MGHYKCCCQAKNLTSTSISSYTWLEQQHQHHHLLWPKQEQCFDGKAAESLRMNVSAAKERITQCETYFEGDYTLRKVLLAVNVICAMAAFALIFVVMTQRKVQVRPNEHFERSRRNAMGFAFFRIGAPEAGH